MSTCVPGSSPVLLPVAPKAGYKYQHKEKSKFITFYDVEPADEESFIAAAMGAGNTFDATRGNFYAGDYTVGDFVSKQYLSRLDFGDASQFDLVRNPMKEAENYEGRETIHAAYLRYDQQLGSRLKLIAGLRLEHTQFDYTGNALHVDAGRGAHHLDARVAALRLRQLAPWCYYQVRTGGRPGPACQLHHDALRPKFRQLVPGDRVNLADKEGLPMGNPDLRNTILRTTTT
ncbi:MAG: outer membrane beta-barrel protein [Alistipes sp.]